MSSLAKSILAGTSKFRDGPKFPSQATKATNKKSKNHVLTINLPCCIRLNTDQAVDLKETLQLKQ
jgi:hypothetical protein